jgi:hypothetical protein
MLTEDGDSDDDELTPDSELTEDPWELELLD